MDNTWLAYELTSEGIQDCFYDLRAYTGSPGAFGYQ